MEQNWAFGIGAIIAIGAAYGIYRFFKGSNDGPTGNVTIMDKVDYELLYDWLKKEYKNGEKAINAGCKFGIMPPLIAKKTFVEEFSVKPVLSKGQDIVCTFIIDASEENIISSHYFIFNEMGQSLKDILHSNKVYIQELKNEGK